MAAKRKTTASSLLAGIGQKPKGKAKSKTPLITVTNEDHIECMRAIANAKMDAKRAESCLKVAEGEFRGSAVELFEGRCRDDVALHTSVKLVGQPEDGDPVSLTFTQPRRCAKMTMEDANDSLHSAFGDEYDDLFTPQQTISIDTSVLTEKQIVKLVEAAQEALGDSFDSAVTVASVIEPREPFFSRRILDPNISLIAKRAADDGLAVPFKPSFKI